MWRDKGNLSGLLTLRNAMKITDKNERLKYTSETWQQKKKKMTTNAKLFIKVR